MNKEQQIFNGKLYFKIIAFEKYEIKDLYSKDYCEFNLINTKNKKHGRNIFKLNLKFLNLKKKPFIL